MSITYHLKFRKNLEQKKNLLNLSVNIKNDISLIFRY